jgi:hypothetical protein
VQKLGFIEPLSGHITFNRQVANRNNSGANWVILPKAVVANVFCALD